MAMCERYEQCCGQVAGVHLPRRKREPVILGAFLAIGGMCLFAAGCATSALPPPVTITVRDSILDDSSKVIQIRNDSAHHLYNVLVVGRNFEEVSSASVRAADELRPGEMVEVGWLEFERWVPRSGETVEVYCDGYASPKVSIVP